MHPRRLGSPLAALLVLGCASPKPAPGAPARPPRCEAAVTPPPLLPPAAPAGDRAPSTRSIPMVCGPVPCTVTVELAGVRALPPEEVFAVMRIFWATEPEAEIWERDGFAVSYLYRDHGYIQVKVAPPGVSWSRDGRSVRVRFAVEEGPQIRIRRYAAFEQVNGVLADPMGGFRPSLAPGDVFSRRRLDLDLILLNRIYRDAGYAEVSADPEADVDAERGEVSVRIPITRGEVHTFGRIRFVGLKKNAEADLRQRITVSEGQRYSETALIRSKEALSATALFHRVVASTTKGQAPAQIDVTFEVDERR